MTTIYIDGEPYDEAVEGARLVKEIERLGIDISHRCGGKAMCTTCRVTFVLGEPDEMSVAEKLRLKESGLLSDLVNVRLSCQILLVDRMDLNVLMPVEAAEWDEPGAEPSDQIEPEFVVSAPSPALNE